jgi:hypothetical protein
MSVENYGRLVGESAYGNEQRVMSTVPARVVCGDCGPGVTVAFDVCPVCGGYAQPWPNPTFYRRLPVKVPGGPPALTAGEPNGESEDAA